MFKKSVLNFKLKLVRSKIFLKKPWMRIGNKDFYSFKKYLPRSGKDKLDFFEF